MIKSSDWLLNRVVSRSGPKPGCPWRRRKCSPPDYERAVVVYDTTKLSGLDLVVSRMVRLIPSGHQDDHGVQRDC